MCNGIMPARVITLQLLFKIYYSLFARCLPFGEGFAVNTGFSILCRVCVCLYSLMAVCVCVCGGNNAEVTSDLYVVSRADADKHI